MKNHKVPNVGSNSVIASHSARRIILINNVQNALFSIDSNKMPGLDGFNWIVSCWILRKSLARCEEGYIQLHPIFFLPMKQLKF